MKKDCDREVKKLAKRKGGESYMLGLGMTELLVISFVLLLFVGGKKLPELAKGVGESIKELRNAAKD
jgi:TatA/E family protein of Tat protein translocase